MKTKYLSLLVLLAVSSLNTADVHAAPRDGVMCPGGYTPRLTQGVLRCSKVIREEAIFRHTRCPSSSSGTIYHRQSGEDYCTRNSDGARLRIVLQHMPFADNNPNNYRLLIDRSGQLDFFVKDARNRTVYKYPVRR